MEEMKFYSEEEMLSTSMLERLELLIVINLRMKSTHS